MGYRQKAIGIKHYLFIASFIIACLLFFTYNLSFAENPQDEYKKIQRDIKTHKKKLESTKKAEQSALTELRKTSAELAEIENQLTIQRGKMKKMQGGISALQTEINQNKENIERQGNLLKKRVRALQKANKENDALLVLISGDDISHALRMFRYISDISTYDYKLINKYKEAVKVLSEKQNALKKLLSELKNEELKLAKLEGSLKEKKKEREVLLVSVRKEKKLFENMIKELQENSNRLRRIIEETERRERELRKKRQAKTDSKEQETDDSGFARLKGKLPWPVNGNVAIHYGTQVDPLFNLPVFRSGIHIKTASGSTIKAVHEGKVVFADDFKGYGQLVIVSHGGGYHTLYGNLSRIFLKIGAIIKEHQGVGESGDSSALGTNGMYFEIRYKGKPLDPEQWLKK
jgi:septal ring factor EnvC (AmiA/AmiB activator)